MAKKLDSRFRGNDNPRSYYMLGKEKDVPSPCINVCAIDDETGYCKGCFRTLAEVAAWPRLSNAQKQAVLDALEVRKKSG